MKSLISIEKNNLIKSYRLLILCISLLIMLIISFTIYRLFEESKIMYSVDILFNLSSQTLFPILFSSFIIASFSRDFKKENIYLIKFSSEKKEEIFMAKILVNISCMFLVYIISVNLYLSFNFLYHNQNYAFIEFMKFNVYEIFIRTNVAALPLFYYILNFSLIGVILVLVIPRTSIAIFLVTLFSIIHITLPLPDYIAKYLFLSSYNVHSALLLVEFPLGRIMEITLINIVNSIALVILSLKIYTKKLLVSGD